MRALQMKLQVPPQLYSQVHHAATRKYQGAGGALSSALKSFPDNFFFFFLLRGGAQEDSMWTLVIQGKILHFNLYFQKNAVLQSIHTE